MKRSIVAFLVVILAFAATEAMALVDVQFNLRYTDPADETEGGTWDLLVQSGAANGMAGIRVVMDGTTGVTGVDTPVGAITPNSDAFDNLTSVFRFQPFGSGVEIVAGDDLAGALVTGVGTGTGAHNVADDDLYPLPLGNLAWDDSSLIASGTFGSTRPAFLEVDPANGNLLPGSTIYALANEFANPATDPVVAATIGATTVRGDGVATDGLKLGDANRDGTVSFADFSTLQNHYNQAGGWDDGDFNDTGDVTFADFSALQNNYTQSATPPAVAAIPEPSSIVLLTTLAGIGLWMRRRW